MSLSPPESRPALFQTHLSIQSHPWIGRLFSSLKQAFAQRRVTPGPDHPRKLRLFVYVVDRCSSGRAAIPDPYTMHWPTKRAQQAMDPWVSLLNFDWTGSDDLMSSFCTSVSVH